jgi:hypothetical protein
MMSPSKSENWRDVVGWFFVAITQCLYFVADTHF